MPSYLDVLFSKSSHTIEGPEYNRYRDSFADPTGKITLFYEVSLLPDRPWSYLRNEIYPALARFLRSKSLDPETGDGIIVALFHGTSCYLIEGRKFLQAFREIEGLSSSAFHFRVLSWLNA